MKSIIIISNDTSYNLQHPAPADPAPAAAAPADPAPLAPLDPAISILESLQRAGRCSPFPAASHGTAIPPTGTH